ncbi:hypothetical protein M3P05_16965 [Sansalvadorimonas sp. 2012CJ34-2]|uniref:Uncharacterized protein n=1 Tax=Parendozoicomonas callyspongiae TaxID=2942213 RepID=A0ABT0PJN9_9GAMM|nr:hypothetical protein [Sansalvadorimonas sp. 2012CJ34-2]MCL6271610.1 hypothetical protein [Sansalvadorimonas sp. 2012CJ34-2]
MRFLYRLVTPAVTLSIALLSAVEGDYIISLSAAIILGLICYNLMDTTDPEKEPQHIPNIIRKGPFHIHFNDTDYPDWIQTEDGHYFSYFGLDNEDGRPNRVDKEGIVYFGVRYTDSGVSLPEVSGSFS